MTPPRIVTTTTPGYVPAEQRALQRLRARYRQDRDLWSTRELAHLHFVRWLYETGRLRP